MGDLFNSFDKFGNRIFYDIDKPDINSGKVVTTSNQTQLAVPLNLNTPYSQIIDDDGNLPSVGGADVVRGGRIYDAVCSPYANSGADYEGADAIHKAINAGKTRIFVRAGIYLITNKISISVGVSITGEDMENTVIKAVTGFSDSYIFEINDTSGLTVSLSNLNIDGNSVASIYGVYNAQPDCIIFIDKCRIRQCNTGIYSSSNNIQISSCEIDGNADGIFSDAGDMKVFGCIFTDNTGTAIEFSGVSVGYICINTFNEVGDAIYLNGTTNVVVANNYIELQDDSNLKSGIYLAGFAAKNIINGNRILGSGFKYGIYIDSTNDNYNTVVSNIVANNTTNAIGGATTANIQDNSATSIVANNIA